jgi:DNA-binding MarR family transcriptional regulator
MATNTARIADDTDLDGLKARYFETVRLMERLHKQFLDLIQVELDDTRTVDINSVQSLILHAIGDAEVLVGDLTQRGYYLGSNVSYNVRRLAESGYLVQERSTHDRRAIKLRLTEKGEALCRRLDALFDDHIRALDGIAMFEDLARASDVLKRLSGFWARFRIG